MRLLIRVDGSPRIGGGHVMRCLTLAEAARGRGHEAAFVTVAAPAGDMVPRLRAAGFAVTALPAWEVWPDDPEGPPHRHFLSLPWQEDARLTAEACSAMAPDWLIWDHYGLDARWVNVVRAAGPGAMRVLALDDLDDRPLGSDLLLDQTRLTPVTQRFPALAALTGPGFALLRPEFAALRPAALARRGGPVRQVLVAPGMADSAGLAPLALHALADFPDLSAEVVMGSASQSVAEVAALVAANPRWHLTLDAGDMAARMAAADLCIGAGGMTTWERCCLGLPTVLVAVAENQRGTAEALTETGAAVTLDLDAARQPGRLSIPIAAARAAATGLTTRAAALVDGQGAARVLDVLEGHLRPITPDDAQLLFDWRNGPLIRAMSLTPEPLEWSTHLAWVEQGATREDGLWCIYTEGGRDLGHVNARCAGRVWNWGFYIGAEDAPKGTGRRMLAAFLRTLLARDDFDRLEAVVKCGNVASEALHRGFGFREGASANPDLLAFTLSRCDLARRYAFTDTTEG